MSDDWFEVYLPENLPLEDARLALAAMAEHLGLKLMKREPFYGEPEYKYVPKP